MAANRDMFVPLMVASASSYPAEPANCLTGLGAGDVTVTIAAGADASGLETDDQLISTLLSRHDTN